MLTVYEIVRELKKEHVKKRKHLLPHEPDFENEEFKPQGHQPETVSDNQGMVTEMIIMHGLPKFDGDAYDDIVIDESLDIFSDLL